MVARGGGAPGGMALGPEVVDAIVAASRFVFEHIGRLKEHMAAARQAMLHSAPPSSLLSSSSLLTFIYQVDLDNV